MPTWDHDREPSLCMQNDYHARAPSTAGGVETIRETIKEHLREISLE